MTDLAREFPDCRMAPRRPVLRWHGGKWLLAPWIIEHLPPHRVYVEPFGGAASVLLRKPRSYAEIYNDLDDWVVNLFRVLRSDRAGELIEKLRLTPFARAEFKDADVICDDPVEFARRLIVRSFMGFGSNAHSEGPLSRTGFRGIVRGINRGFRSTGFRSTSNRSGTTPAHDWANYPEALALIVDRWRGVVIEQVAATEVMARHDTPETLHYADPPYLPDTRAPSGKKWQRHRMYRHEMDVAGHQRLLAFLQTLKGYVVLSGYHSPMYDDALAGWRRVERSSFADGARERTEVLWMNPRAAAALSPTIGPLFAGAAE